MAGLGPATHDFSVHPPPQIVRGRSKPGHDKWKKAGADPRNLAPMAASPLLVVIVRGASKRPSPRRCIRSRGLPHLYCPRNDRQTGWTHRNNRGDPERSPGTVQTASPFTLSSFLSRRKREGHGGATEQNRAAPSRTSEMCDRLAIEVHGTTLPSRLEAVGAAGACPAAVG